METEIKCKCGSTKLWPVGAECVGNCSVGTGGFDHYGHWPNYDNPIFYICKECWAHVDLEKK